MAVDVTVKVNEHANRAWLTSSTEFTQAKGTTCEEIVSAIANAMPKLPEPSPFAPYIADRLFPSVNLPPYYLPSSWWYRTPTPDLPTIRQVIFNDPATIVIWGDHTKTVVKCQPGDTFSKETGLAMAIIKKVYGNKGNYNDVFRKWVPRNE